MKRQSSSNSQFSSQGDSDIDDIIFEQNTVIDKYKSELKVQQKKTQQTEEKQEIQENKTQSINYGIEAMSAVKKSLNVYPFILVNIGSGVSILEVRGPSRYQRLGGTMIGGATLLGLSNLLIGQTNFDKIIQLSKKGNTQNTDLLIKDIYPNPGEKVQKQELTASSFGKVEQKGIEEGAFRKQDIARSLISMIGHNISQMACLVAKRQNIERIYFVGNFIRDNDYTMQLLSFGVKQWSRNKISALFLKHNGFLGALGCFCKDWMCGGYYYD